MSKSKICYTSLKKQILYGALAVLVIVALITSFVFMINLKPNIFDENAKQGVPKDLPKEYGYSNYEAQDVCSVGICGNPKIEGKNVYLYLTNPKTNKYCLRAEIFSVNFPIDSTTGQPLPPEPGKILGKSGFLKPGEYTEFVTIKKDLKGEETPIMIKIATYEEETELSHGIFFVNTTFNPKKR